MRVWIPSFVDVGGRRLRHVIRRGGTKAVVLVHGFGSSLETWAGIFPVLASEGWTVAALDLTGHGESSSGGDLRELAGTVPTLVIWGACDAVIPPLAAGELDAPCVELHVLPGRGHMVQIEAADEVNRLLAAFLCG